MLTWKFLLIPPHQTLSISQNITSIFRHFAIFPVISRRFPSCPVISSHVSYFFKSHFFHFFLFPTLPASRDVHVDSLSLSRYSLWPLDPRRAKLQQQEQQQTQTQTPSGEGEMGLLKLPGFRSIWPEEDSRQLALVIIVVVIVITVYAYVRTCVCML